MKDKVNNQLEKDLTVLYKKRVQCMHKQLIRKRFLETQTGLAEHSGIKDLNDMASNTITTDNSSLIHQVTKALEEVLKNNGLEATSLQNVTLTERAVVNDDLYLLFTFEHYRTGAVFISYSASGTTTPPWDNLRNKINYPLTTRSGFKQKEIVAKMGELGIIDELLVDDVSKFWRVWNVVGELSFEDAKNDYCKLVEYYSALVPCLNASDKLSSNKKPKDTKKTIFDLNAVISF